MKKQSSTLPAAEAKSLLQILQKRFEQNMNRHKNIDWEKVLERFTKHPEKLASLYEMEMTGGEPDVVAFDKKTGTFTFYDCAAESPKGRRSICYDRAALNARKENKPKNAAMDMAAEMGIEMLDEEAYRYLQTLGAFDTKTSSWIITPDNIRNLGGALFGDCRYKTVFIYHNGADSYYAARGFRGMIQV
jgi:transposase